jgi:hypothetical protein
MKYYNEIMNTVDVLESLKVHLGLLVKRMNPHPRNKGSIFYPIVRGILILTTKLHQCQQKIGR